MMNRKRAVDYQECCTLSIAHFLLFFLGFSLNAFPARADYFIDYQQSQEVWSVYSQIQQGVSTSDGANQLLNQLLGQPSQAYFGFVYSPVKIDVAQFSFKEFRAEGLGYAVATNPVLPFLNAWAGAGLEVVFGYQWFNFFAGNYFAKYANGYSTDLIDHSVVVADDLKVLGGGVQFQTTWKYTDNLLANLSVYTRHTVFFSNSGTISFNQRWRIEHRIDFLPFGLRFIGGSQPVPGYERSSPVWDYVYQLSLTPDFLTLVGGGISYSTELLGGTEFLAGYFGGYIGGEIAVRGSDQYKVFLKSYGLETSTSFQGQGVRVFEAAVQWSI